MAMAFCDPFGSHGYAKGFVEIVKEEVRSRTNRHSSWMELGHGLVGGG